MMLSLNRRSSNGLSMNTQYTLGKSRGTTGGSNEANTAANNANPNDLAAFDYDDGYNNFDVRHTFNVSMLYSLPYGEGRKYGANASGFTQALLGGWDIGGIANARSGIPVQVQIVRPDVVYRDAAGLIFANPAADRVARHQHAWRRRVAQRAPSRPDRRCRPVHQGRRPAVPEPGRVRDAAARHVRQPRAQLDRRSRLQADRLLLREALPAPAGRTSSSAAKSSTCSTS